MKPACPGTRHLEPKTPFADILSNGHPHHTGGNQHQSHDDKREHEKKEGQQVMDDVDHYGGSQHESRLEQPHQNAGCTVK